MFNAASGYAFHPTYVVIYPNNHVSVNGKDAGYGQAFNKANAKEMAAKQALARFATGWLCNTVAITVKFVKYGNLPVPFDMQLALKTISHVATTLCGLG